MTDPDRDRSDRDRTINRMTWIAFILAFLVMLLGIIYNRPTVAPAHELAPVESMRSS